MGFKDEVKELGKIVKDLQSIEEPECIEVYECVAADC